MSQRSRRLLAIALPLVAVLAAAGFYVGHRLRSEGCADGFPTVDAAAGGQPRWQRADGADPAGLAGRVAPFGAWASVAHEADPDELFGENQTDLVDFLGDRLVVAAGRGPSGSGYSGTVSAVDPGDGKVAWARGFAGSHPAGGSFGPVLFATLQLRERDQTARPQVALLDTAGGVRWCTELAEGERVNEPILRSGRTGGGDVAVLHENTLTALRGGSGERVWTAPAPAFENATIRLRADAFAILGDRVLLAPFRAFSPQLVTANVDTAKPFPVVALDAATGREAWRYTMAPAASGNWMQAVVATTGELAVVVGAAFGPVERYRMAAVDRSGAEVWHVDGVPWRTAADADDQRARAFGELLLVAAEKGLVAYRLADGSVAWRADLPATPSDLRGAARAGDFLLVPTPTELAVLDVHTGRGAGSTGLRNARDVVANDRFIAVSTSDGLYVWQRAK